MRLRWREDNANSVFSGSEAIEGPVAGGTCRDPTNVRDCDCLDIRRRCRSSPGGEEILGNRLGDFTSPEAGFNDLPLSEGEFILGTLGTGDDLA